MTDTSPRPAAGPDAMMSTRSDVSGWAGWVVFAGAMLVLMGVFQAIEGLVALFRTGYYAVPASDLVVSVNYNTWGWIHLILGVIAILVGFGLITGNTVARVLGVILAGLSAIVNLAFIAAYPVWSTILIALDVIIIYAIIVHGRELQR